VKAVVVMEMKNVGDVVELENKTVIDVKEMVK
jgi:hypothetical protein